MMKFNKLTNATVFILTISIIVSLFAFPVNAGASNTYDFSNFTEVDSMAFVEEHGIKIPSKLQQSEFLSTFTQELILQSYETPNVPFCFNYSDTQAYAEEIRSAVKNYVNLDAIPMTASATGYSLLYNKVQDANGNWVTSGGAFNSKWYDYNCYAFSINRAEQPQFYSSYPYIQYQPGDMSGAGTFWDCLNINQLAEIIRADLIAMGYSNISLSSSIPTINSSQELICVRMKYDADYHFMKYDINTNAWYHKPGSTAVLKYNYVPSNDMLWYAEYCNASGTYPSTSVYDSTIVFISYSKNQINVGQNSSSREYIEPNKDVFCEINISTVGHYDINLTSAHTIEYEIYDEEFDVVSSGSGTSIHTCLVATGASKYYLRMNFVSNTSLHYVDVSIDLHSHSYTNSYLWHSYSQHKATCCCGYYTMSSHVLASGSFPSTGEHGTCLLCGGPVSMGVINSISIDDLYYSSNGSYILPNGNIVLVPEDVSAYINGTLTFIFE